jgi:hypothetical protein
LMVTDSTILAHCDAVGSGAVHPITPTDRATQWPVCEKRPAVRDCGQLSFNAPRSFKGNLSRAGQDPPRRQAFSYPCVGLL